MSLLEYLSSAQVLAFPDYERATRAADLSCWGRMHQQTTLAQQWGTYRTMWYGGCLFQVGQHCQIKKGGYPLSQRPGQLRGGINKNRPLFYGAFLEICSDHQPLRNLFSLAENIPRMQRWQDFLSGYTFKLTYRPGKTRLMRICYHDCRNQVLRRMTGGNFRLQIRKMQMSIL